MKKNEYSIANAMKKEKHFPNLLSEKKKMIHLMLKCHFANQKNKL